MKTQTKNNIIIAFALLLAVVAFAVLINPYLILERKCFKVADVVGCGGEKCRIILENGRSGFTYGPTLKGDTVCENLKYIDVYNVVLNEQ